MTLPSQYPVKPGDQMTALVSANSTVASFTLMMKDATVGWTFSTTQTGSGFARSSAEVIAEAPSSCSILFCSEVSLADFGQVNYSGSSVIDSAGTKGPLPTFSVTWTNSVTWNNLSGAKPKCRGALRVPAPQLAGSHSTRSRDCPGRRSGGRPASGAKPDP